MKRHSNRPIKEEVQIKRETCLKQLTESSSFKTVLSLRSFVDSKPFLLLLEILPYYGFNSCMEKGGKGDINMISQTLILI